jgi:nucleoside-diphosphate-sugar epimerase
MRKILVTGASGFIGKNLIPELIKKHGQNNFFILTAPESEEQFLRSFNDTVFGYKTPEKESFSN